MGKWKNNDFEVATDLASIALLFEAKKVKRMYDIAGLFPTKISRRLGINSDRYSVKLSSPEKFSVLEILKLAYILGIDPNLILDVIQKETEILVAKRLTQKST